MPTRRVMISQAIVLNDLFVGQRLIMKKQTQKQESFEIGGVTIVPGEKKKIKFLKKWIAF